MNFSFMKSTKMANVSIATVSRVINRSDGFRKKERSS
jgi:DNA-binding LacI/PurR family transcriptional regulator